MINKKFITGVATLSLLFSAIGAGLSTPAQAAPKDTTDYSVCKSSNSYTIIGIRGSGQQGSKVTQASLFNNTKSDSSKHYGFGEQVTGAAKELAKSIKEKNKKAKFNYISVDYPAEKFLNSSGQIINNEDGLLKWLKGFKLMPYAESVTDGMTNLSFSMGKIVKNCPNTNVVIIGYSQGAQVTHDYLARAGKTPDTKLRKAVNKNIKSVHLISDPLRGAGDSVATKTTIHKAPKYKTGIFGSTKNVEIAKEYKGRVYSYCSKGDFFCDSKLSIGASLNESNTTIKKLFNIAMTYNTNGIKNVIPNIKNSMSKIHGGYKKSAESKLIAKKAMLNLK